MAVWRRWKKSALLKTHTITSTQALARIALNFVSAPTTSINIKQLSHTLLLNNNIALCLILFANTWFWDSDFLY